MGSAKDSTPKCVQPHDSQENQPLNSVKPADSGFHLCNVSQARGLFFLLTVIQTENTCSVHVGHGFCFILVGEGSSGVLASKLSDEHLQPESVRMQATGDS